eukprot:scaffold14515_cov75-Phaeocystis_antarctica.AAC.4
MGRAGNVSLSLACRPYVPGRRSGDALEKEKAADRPPDVEQARKMTLVDDQVARTRKDTLGGACPKPTLSRSLKEPNTKTLTLTRV